MGGTGFLASPNPALGAPNAGLDPDLDALTAYALGLPPVRKSPHRAADGNLTQAARRGAGIFVNNSGGAFDVGCNDCHPAPNFTDLGFHDVGGLTSPPEYEGPAFNTPTLVGAWAVGPYIQALGGYVDSQSLGGVVRNAQYGGLHGDTSGLDRTQLSDLEAFLNSIDGQIAETGLSGIADTDGPRVLAMRPINLNEVEIIFDESVDPVTAGNAANYALTDGSRFFDPTAAVVNDEWGNRVRLAIALRYAGCDVNYTLLPGPIEDRAGAIAGGANNVLDINDPENQVSFALDGTMTVTFGDTGLETFGSVAKDASFIAGLTTWSHARLWLYPYTNPEMKGFVAFDFVPTLANQCGVTASADILDARFSGVPSLGHRTTLELRRCLMPWGEPPNDWCANCPGSVTVGHSTYPTVAWHQSGARAVGGTGTNPNEYYPSGSFDVTSAVDATTTVPGIHERMEFAGPGLTNAFRFWFDHPAINYGHSVEVVGNNAVGTEFWGSDEEDGRYGLVLSITFAVDPNAAPIYGDVAPPGGDGNVDVADVLHVLAAFADGSCCPGADLSPCGGDGNVDVSDILVRPRRLRRHLRLHRLRMTCGTRRACFAKSVLIASSRQRSRHH